MCGINSNKLNSIASKFPNGQIVLTIPIRLLYVIGRAFIQGIRAAAIIIKGE